MADPGVDAGAPNLNLTPEEKRVYGILFKNADTDNVGVVTGEIAVKFFEKTKLDSRVLGEIWQIADKENRGFLTPAGFGVVLRLIGHAQAGREPTAELALQPGPLPRFDGFAVAPVPAGPTSPGLAAQATGSVAIRIPPLTPDKVAQYASLFERQNLQNGNMLPGDQAKQIFEKSGLPNEVLGRIWMLADTEQRGALVQTEFVIAMHLLSSMKTGALRGLPTILPAGLYDAATRRGPANVPPPRQQSPAGATSPISAIPRQLSGQAPLAQMRTGSPLGRSPLAPQTTGDWLITPVDKSRFDQLYAELDKTNKGFITGDEAVVFFGQSKLSEDTLAQIWDLADIKSEGRLNRDEFAIAMYLIRQQRSIRDGSSPLPATLPANLIPPSMRSQVRPQTAASASAFELPPPPPLQQQVPPPQPKLPSALDDLFGLDDPTPPATAQPQVPAVTGGSGLNDPFSGSMSPAAPSSPIRPSPTGNTFKPFVPSSSFGRGLATHPTGGSNSSATALPKPVPLPVSAQDDLLGDGDDTSKAIDNSSTELANLSNQIGSLTKQMQDVQGQRATTQNELNQSIAQKKNFEQRLSQLRTMYEKEAQDVRSLEQQLATSKNETKKLQTDIALINATYQDLQTQHSQLSTALQADQQENAGLKERIRTVNTEIAQLKPQIEKLKGEARQLKGLVAINKKQLATNESERDKMKTELDDLTKSNEDLARQVNSSSQVASPALSTNSVNNPFFRRTASTDITATLASPPLRQYEKTFDDVFGPYPQGTSSASADSFATPTSTTPGATRPPGGVDPAAEPPAPPESRQLTPSNLPFADAAESLSTSRQVSPPISRTSQAEASAEAQQQSAAQPIERAPTGQSLVSGSGSGSENTKNVAASPPTEIKFPGNGPSSFFSSPPTDETVKSPVSAPAGDKDPFAAMDNARAKEEFDSAFASFNSVQTARNLNGGGVTGASSGSDTGNAFPNFNKEFPPISELENADESDSDEERGGFDDDFAPASPPTKVVAEATPEAKSSSPTASKVTPSEPSAAAPAAAAGSTPTQDQLPASENAVAPSTPPAQTASTSHIRGPSVDELFGSAIAAHPVGVSAPPATQSTAAAAPVQSPSKGAFDDLDDDFEGLEDAKEGSADDDFANISRSGLDDFNPVFDSSPPPSQPKSESTATTIAPFGTESSFDFGSLSQTSAAGGSPSGPSASSATVQPKASSSQEWDSLFANLDDSPVITSSSSPPANGNGNATEPSRPGTVGRALTEEGIHDDPILKNLTGMGYPRTDALAALEKYDYNLERAANYLASQS